MYVMTQNAEEERRSLFPMGWQNVLQEICEGGTETLKLIPTHCEWGVMDTLRTETPRNTVLVNQMIG